MRGFNIHAEDSLVKALKDLKKAVEEKDKVEEPQKTNARFWTKIGIFLMWLPKSFFDFL